MDNIFETKVGRVVAGNYRTARVFSAHGIDFCCKGGITVKEACRVNDVDEVQLLLELEKATSMPDELSVNDMNLSQLTDHIINKHHHYVTENMPVIHAYLDKLCRVHGGRHPELFKIFELFNSTCGALTSHMKKEELILFPYIKKLESAQQQGQTRPEPSFGSIDNPIIMMEQEHEAEGERLAQIAGLSDNYTCPPDGCQTYRVAFAMLKEFEDDLHRHIHLENNILFPKAKAMYHQYEGVAQ